MEMNKKTVTIIAAVSVIALILAGIAIGITVITAPEHITGIPLDPTPTPTPTPTVTPTELHLTSNNTDPFYKGDTLTMTATLTPAQTGILINLYNNGLYITNSTTDASGHAVFNRQPQLGPYDYTITAELP